MPTVPALRTGTEHGVPPRDGLRAVRRQALQVRVPQQRVGGSGQGGSGLAAAYPRASG